MEKKDYLTKRVFINDTRPLMDDKSHGYVGDNFSLDRYLGLREFGDADNGLKVALHGIPNIEMVMPLSDILIDTKNEQIVFCANRFTTNEPRATMAYNISPEAVVHIWMVYGSLHEPIAHVSIMKYPARKIPRDGFELPRYPVWLKMKGSDDRFIQINEETLPTKITGEAAHNKYGIERCCRLWELRTDGVGIKAGDIVWYGSDLYKAAVIASIPEEVPKLGEVPQYGIKTGFKLVNLIQEDPDHESYKLISADKLILNHKAFICPKNIMVVYDKYFRIFYNGELNMQYSPGQKYPDTIQFLLDNIFSRLKAMPENSYQYDNNALELATQVMLHEYIEDLPIGKEFMNDAVVIYQHPNGFAYNFVSSVTKILNKAVAGGVPVETDGWR